MTLNATVTSTGTPVTHGQVYFCNSASAASCSPTNNLAVAQLSSAGKAVYKFIPGPGNHNYIAVYAGLNSYSSSASAASSTLTVTGQIHSFTTLNTTGTRGNYTLATTVYGSGSSTPAGNISILGTDANFNPVTFANSTAALAANSPFFAVHALPWGGTVYADFNGDGIPDAVEIGNFGWPFHGPCGQSSDAYETEAAFNNGNGDGTFQSGAAVQLPCDSSEAAVGDLNNDGSPDLIVDGYDSSNGSYFVGVLLNNGSGGFALSRINNPLPLIAGGWGQGQITVADFNHDGNLDIAIYNSSAVQIALGDGAGNLSFISSQVPVGEINNYSTIQAGDLNNDGYPDLFWVDSPAQAIQVFLGNGDGTFTAASPYTNSAITFGASVTAADLNNDGNLDLAVSNSATTGLTVLWGDGSGDFPATTPLLYAGGALNAGIGVADLDNDGKMDLFAYGFNGSAYSGPGALAFFKGDGAGSFLLTTCPIPNLPSVSGSITVADANGDGSLDILSGSVLLITTQSSTATITGFTPPSTPGNYYIYPSFIGDSNYLPSKGSTSVVEPKGDLTLTLSAPPSPVAPYIPIPITATLSGSPNLPMGYIFFYWDNGDPMGSAALENGVATLNFTFQCCATNTFHAVFNGDSNFNQAVSPSISVTARIPSSIDTYSSFHKPFTYGAAIPLVATVGGSAGSGVYPTGTVTFSNGSKTLGTANVMANTQAGLTVPAGVLPAGPTTITVSYSGDNTFASATTSDTVTLAKAQPTITFNPTATTGAYGSLIDIDARLIYTGAPPTGLVTFYDGSAAIGTATPNNGIAILQTTSLAIGTHTITLSYAGDSNYNPVTSTTSLQVTITNKPTSIDTSGFSKPFTYGSPIPLVVTVAGGSSGIFPTGTVTFSSGATMLGATSVMANTQAVLTVPIGKLPAGPTTITISYSGDKNFAGATASGIVTLSKAQPALRLTASSTSTDNSAPITFSTKLTYAGAAPTGLVTLYDGGTAIVALTPVNGVATYNDTNLSMGTHSITARYAGDANYNSATSSVVSVTATKRPTTVLTLFSSKAFTYGSPISLVIGVSGGSGGVYPTGTVTFSNGSTVLGTTNVMSNTQAALTVPANDLSAGPSTIHVSYSGDANFASATATGTVTLAKAQPTITLTSSAATAAPGVPIIFTAKLAYPGTGAPPSGAVSLYDGSTFLATLTPNSGLAVFNYSGLSTGSHSISAVFSGDVDYNPATSSSVAVNILKAATILTSGFSKSFTYGSPISLVVTIAGGSGGVYPTGTVTFRNGATNLGTA
ncbi:MAG TPA: Ig-like domain repeat protein, partial [Acidobacteriaceae bacterium]